MLNDLYKIESKEFMEVLELKCEKVTLTSVPIVKCMGRVHCQKYFTKKPMRQKVSLKQPKIELIKLYKAPSTYFGGAMDISQNKSKVTYLNSVK